MSLFAPVSAELLPLRERGLEILSSLSSPSDSAKQKFDSQGFLVERSFITTAECTDMIDRISTLVEENWHPDDPTTPSAVSVFRTDSKQTSAQGSSDYFLDSADAIHYFAEKDAVDGSGALLPNISKLNAINKAGHGLHVVDPIFNKYSTSVKIRSLVHTLGWSNPVIPQSMYIFKQPKIGGEVTSHQDSTFLHTEPRQTCLGLWLALHDATIENGCLWVRPGSHHEPLRRKFARNAEHFAGDESKPQMVFEDLEIGVAAAAPWEGALPDNSWPPPCEGLFKAGFCPVECKAGDLVIFPGTLDHLSLPNYSTLPRHTFQLHLIDGPEAGIKWSDSNWLQYPPGNKFLQVGVENEKKIC